MRCLASLLCIVLSVSLLSSCSLINADAIHDANALNIALHKEKKELKGSAGYGSVLGFNADASYTVSEKIVIMAGANYNHQYLVRKRPFGEDHFNLKNHYVEGAAGYYKFLENNYVNSIEISAGYGNGLTKKSTHDRFEGNYHKYFLQVNAGHVTDKFEFGLGARYSGLFYPDLYQKVYHDVVGKPEFHHKNVRLPSLELAVMQAYGGKKLKATLQYGLSIPLKEIKFTQSGDDFMYTQNLNNWSAIFQVGIRYNFLLKNQEKP